MKFLPRAFEVPKELLGRRVLLRPYEATDGPALMEAVDESRAIVETQWPVVQTTVEESIDYCARAKSRWIDRDDLPYAMFERATGRFLGGTGLVRNDWIARRFEIGYWMRTGDTGKGYVLEAVAVLTRCAFDVLGANRVEIRCDAENERSRRVAEYSGFTLEGTLRRFRSRKDGTIADEAIFGVVREDYDKLLPTWARHFDS